MLDEIFKILIIDIKYADNNWTSFEDDMGFLNCTKFSIVCCFSEEDIRLIFQIYKTDFSNQPTVACWLITYSCFENASTTFNDSVCWAKVSSSRQSYDE